MKKIELVVLFAILGLGLALRLYKLERPIADWHSWRQADTAAVARNFTKDGFTPFVPKYDDMSSQANGLDNPNRYRFVEFPIYNSLIAAVWSFTGTSAVYARLTTALITLGSTALLYFLVKHFSSWKIAVLSAFFFATVPYNVFYSTTILPGPLMVFGILGLYLSFAKWLENEKNLIWYLLSVVFANLALLTWPIAAFFMLPPLYLAFEKYKLATFKKISLWILLVTSFAPFFAWRFWISQFPEGIPNWKFLLNEGNIRFKGAFFRWIVAERMGKLILAVGGFALMIIGLVKKPQKEKLFFYSWLGSVLVYVTVMASGNVRHDYYQVPIIPIAAIFMAQGTYSLFTSREFHRILGPFVAIFLILTMFAFGYFEIKGFYWINKPQIVSAGAAVDRLLPKDAIVIAPYNGDAAFLYQTNRHGYPIVDRPLEKFIDEGTIYLVSVDVNDAGIQSLAKNCKVVEQTGEYVIVEMFKECIGK